MAAPYWREHLGETLAQAICGGGGQGGLVTATESPAGWKGVQGRSTKGPLLEGNADLCVYMYMCVHGLVLYGVGCCVHVLWLFTCVYVCSVYTFVV